MTERYYFFCDEAGTTQDRFLVVAGISVHAKMLHKINHGINVYRKMFNMNSELKWQKITNQKKHEYQELIDYFFHLNMRDFLHFHSLIVPYRLFDHKTLNGNDKNLSLHKILYQLILHRFCKTCGTQGNELFIYPDLCSKPFGGSEARRILNLGLRKNYGISHNPVREVRPLVSAECNVLQLNDVILGALCAHRNQRHLKIGGREAKHDLAEYVLQRTGLDSYQKDTPIGGPARFTVWNLRSRFLRIDNRIRGEETPVT